MSREDRGSRLVEPDEMVPPLLCVVSREADNVNSWRVGANLWDTGLLPAERLCGCAGGCDSSTRSGGARAGAIHSRTSTGTSGSYV
jgi:hypothetical protein